MWPILRKALSAAMAVVAHAAIAAVLIVCIAGVHYLILALNHGEEMLVYGGCRCPTCSRPSISQ
jgi:hypothetical protein